MIRRDLQGNPPRPSKSPSPERVLGYLDRMARCPPSPILAGLVRGFWRGRDDGFGRVLGAPNHQRSSENNRSRGPVLRFSCPVFSARIIAGLRRRNSPRPSTLQQLECESSHNWNLTVPEASNAVHPSGNPMNHSHHVGFGGPPRTVAKPSPLFDDAPFRL
jgi:hypothetical protein